MATIRRCLLAFLSFVTVGGGASAQSTTSAVQSKALPPSRESLDRLNLRSEWTAYVPLDGRADGLAVVQVVDAGQIFAQTRAGLLVAIDAVSGAKQWTFRYPRPYSNLHPVGVTDRFVFAVNVAQLYCFHRYTGLLEFTFELPGSASSGPVADHHDFFIVLGGNKLAAYRYPQPIQIDPQQQKRGDGEGSEPERGGYGVAAGGRVLRGGARSVNPADQVARRYADRFLPPSMEDPEFEETRFPPSNSFDGEEYGGLNQRTASISSLPRVTPPYSMHRYVTTPSIVMLPTLRQPYQSKPDFMRYNQRTPSTVMLPPSVARIEELSNLRPKPVEPTLRWNLLSSRRISFEPILTNPVDSLSTPLIWLTTQDRMIFAVSKKDRSIQIVAKTSGIPVAPGAGPVLYRQEQLLGFFPLDDGTLLGLDLTSGDLENPAVHFRAYIGGRLNHSVVPTRFGGVYASGENAGITRVDTDTGEVTWRTASTDDRLLAVNEEHAYVMNHRQELLIYDARRAYDPVTRQARPLSRLDLPGFNLPVTNAQSDRIYVAADNGLLICLRSNSAKYLKPLQVAPPRLLPPKPKKTEPDEAAAPAPAAGN